MLRKKAFNPTDRDDFTTILATRNDCDGSTTMSASPLDPLIDLDISDSTVQASFSCESIESHDAEEALATDYTVQMPDPPTVDPPFYPPKVENCSSSNPEICSNGSPSTELSSDHATSFSQQEEQALLMIYKLLKDMNSRM